MHVALGDIVMWIGRFLWPFERVGAAFMVAPLFSASNVPPRIRLGMAFVTVIAVWPLIPSVPAVSPFSVAGVVITFQELVIGAAMGFILRLIFESVALGGTVIATTMGLGFASTVDPQRGVRVSAVGQFFTIFTAMIFLALNGHLLLIQLVGQSFKTLPIGVGLGAEGFRAVVDFATQMFLGAVKVALPALVALLVVHMAFGVMSRAAPTLNLFGVGFPITMFLGFVILWMSLRSLLPNVMMLSDRAFDLMNALLVPG